MKNNIDCAHLAAQHILIADIRHIKMGAGVGKILLVQKEEGAFVVVQADDFPRGVDLFGKKLRYQFRADGAAGSCNKDTFVPEKFHLLLQLGFSVGMR